MPPQGELWLCGSCLELRLHLANPGKYLLQENGGGAPCTDGPDWGHLAVTEMVVNAFTAVTPHMFGWMKE